MPPSPLKLGIIAGEGGLPGRLVEVCRWQERECVVLALEGHTDPATVADVPHVWARLGTVITGIRALREAGVEEVVMAGPVKRPALAALRPDRATARVAARIMTSALGDDNLLSALIGELEEMGFSVVGVESVIDGLIAREGRYGAHEADAQAREDIARGVEVAKGLGRMDIGQAVVVQQGMVLGVEAIEGTDALLERCATLKREGPGGVLVKIRKPDQDPRADLPTIGPWTVEGAAGAGLRGIAVEAGGALVVDAPEATRRADEAGLFLLGITVAD